MNFKICGSCKKEKLLSEFYKNGANKTNGVAWRCKECQKYYNKNQRNKNKKYPNPPCKKLNELITKEFLIEELINKNIPYAEVAKKIPCDKTSILRYCKKQGISLIFGWDKILTKEFLTEQLIKKMLIQEEVARLVGCDQGVIKRKIKEYGIIPVVKWESILTRNFLTENYNSKKFSGRKICQITGCNDWYLKKKLREFSITIRNISEAKKGKKLGPQSEELRKKKSKRMGGNKYAYIDGRTFLRQKIHNLSKYILWRKLILKRDNFTCQKCSSKENLEIHHIKEFSLILQEFLQQYPQLNPIDNKEELTKLANSYVSFWDTKNGQTLCYECHDRIEKQKYIKEPLCLS